VLPAGHDDVVVDDLLWARPLARLPWGVGL
jgi:hypothetical protein